MALFLGLLDYLFSIALKWIIAGSAIAIGIAVVVMVVGVVTGVILNRQTAQ